MGRSRMAMAAALLLAGAAGCGEEARGGGGRGGSHLPENVCALFAVAEVEAIVGEELQVEFEGPHLCSLSGPAESPIAASIQFEHHPDYAYAFARHVARLEEIWATRARQVSGIGAKAVIIEYALAPPHLQLIVARGEEMLVTSVAAEGLTATAAEPVLRDLMTLLIERL